MEVSDPFHITSDERLPAARDATDPYITAPRFHHLASADGEHAGIELKRIAVIRHRPHRRCVIEYAGRSRTTGKKIALIAKINAKDRHQAQFDRQRLLWQRRLSRPKPRRRLRRPALGRDSRMANVAVRKGPRPFFLVRVAERGQSRRRKANRRRWPSCTMPT